MQDIITILKTETKKSKKQENKKLGEIWKKAVPILRVCTDGKVNKLMEENKFYGDTHHQDQTAYFGGSISADEIPYIVLPGAEEHDDEMKERLKKFRYSLGVIVRKKENKKISKKDDYLFCVVAETDPDKIQAGSLVREETNRNMSSPEKEREVDNTLGEVSIYAAWILKGLNVSSLKNIKRKYAFEDFSGLDFTVAVMDSALFQKISN